MYELTNTFGMKKATATTIYNVLAENTDACSSASGIMGAIAAVVPGAEAAAPILALISVATGTINKQLTKGKTSFISW